MIYFQANALRPWPLPTPPTPATTSRCQRPPSAPSWQSPACSWPQTPFQRVGNGAISASLAACCEDRMIWPEFSPASATTTTFQKLNIETMMLLFIQNFGVSVQCFQHRQRSFQLHREQNDWSHRALGLWAPQKWGRRVVQNGSHLKLKKRSSNKRQRLNFKLKPIEVLRFLIVGWCLVVIFVKFKKSRFKTNLTNSLFRINCE